MIKKVGKFWNVINNSETKVADIYIYGAITKWAWKELGEVSSQAFARELNDLEDVDTINLNINSPGGDVFEAHAIFNNLRRYARNNNIKIISNIDGLAASAASYLALACHEINMGIGSMLMIHNASGYARGESKEMRVTADRLDKVKESILDVYMTKSSLEREKLSEMMDKTTWMNADEALENGFIDKIENYSNSESEVTNYSDFEILNSYDNVPGEILNRYSNNKKKIIPVTTPLEVENIKREEKMTKEQLKNKYPEIYDQIREEGREEGINNERSRIQDIDNLKIPEGAKKLLENAKYTEIKNASDVALEVINSDIYKADNEIKKMEEDYQNSGADEIENTDPSSKEDLDENVLNAAIDGYNNA